MGDRTSQKEAIVEADEVKESLQYTGSNKREKKYVSKQMDNDWDLTMITEFIATLMKATICTDVQELKYHTIIACVWRKVEQDMKIDVESLKSLWYYRLHMQLFCTEEIYLNDVKIKLINYMHKKEVSASKDIKWQDVLSYFNGYTHQFLYRIFRNLLKFAKSKTKTSNLADNINYLYKHMIPNITENEEDRILPRLIYENGNVKHMDTDIEQALQYTGRDHSDSSSEE